MTERLLVAVATVKIECLAVEDFITPVVAEPPTVRTQIVAVDDLSVFTDYFAVAIVKAMQVAL